MDKCKEFYSSVKLSQRNKLKGVFGVCTFSVCPGKARLFSPSRLLIIWENQHATRSWLGAASFRGGVEAVSWWGTWEPPRALLCVAMTVAKHRVADASRTSPRRGRGLCLHMLQTLYSSESLRNAWVFFLGCAPWFPCSNVGRKPYR